MSDVYSTESEDPIDMMERRASLLAMQGSQRNPDEAARAIRLAETTGLPPSIVSNDLKNVDEQVRSQMTSQIIRGNSHLQDYINSHPLAAELSNDDWGNLDTISQSLQRLKPSARPDFGPPGRQAIFDVSSSIIGAGIKGYAEHAPPMSTPGQWLRSEDIKNYPFLSSVASLIGAPLEAVASIFAGGVGAVKGVASEGYAQLTGDRPTGERFGREIAALAEWSMMRGDIQLRGPRAVENEIRAAIHNDIAVLEKEMRPVAPYLADGKEPPVGVHPAIDAVKKEQAEIDGKNLDQLLKEAQQSTTRERDPGSFARFIEQQTNAEISISAEAVRKLYGDKPPTPDDGILGFVPRLSDQLTLAEMEGGDITVPLSQWLARVEPDVAKALKDDIRVRRGGVTLNEAKVAEKVETDIKSKQLPVIFKTSKGSEYQVGPDGITTRNKSYHPEHGVKDQGLQPPSEKTLYVTKEEALALSEFQTQGTKKSIAQVGEGQYGVRYEEGKDQGKFEKRTVVTPKTEPAVGLIPVELFDGGKRVHFGNEIVEVGQGVLTTELPSSGSPAVDAVRSSAALDQPTTKAIQLEMRDVTRMEDREIFERATAIGLTKDQYIRFQKLIERRAAEDVEAQTKRAQAEEKRRQTAEWKENRQKVVEEIRTDFDSRPDIATDNFFRNGTLFGEKLNERPKINPETLTEEQFKSLPEQYFSVEKGMHPDDIANLLGYQTGKEMLDGFVALREQRIASGLAPQRFTERMIAAEADARMEQRYGNLEKNIIEEAKEHVLSETQLDLLHEQTLYFAEKAGQTLPIESAALKAQALEHFNNLSIRGAKSDTYLAAAGRAGRGMTNAFLKEDWAEAFRLSQQQFFSTFLAKEAKRFEIEQARLEKLAGRFEKPKVTGVDTEHANFIQALLKQAGYTVKLTPEEIKANVDFQQIKTLPDLIAHDRSFGWEPVVADGVLEGKPIEQMTVGEFREFKDAIDSLNHIGREIEKIEVMGEKADFAAFSSQVVANLKERPLRTRESQEGGFWHRVWQLDASLTRMEEMIKDFDLQKELGPMFNAVIVPMMKSKAKEFDMLTELSKYFKEQRGATKAWRKTLRDPIPQDFLIDPVTATPFDLSRENLIQIMLNWGNRSNIEKISRGYASLELGRTATREEGAIFSEKLKSLIDQHATKEDWEFVQSMWRPFKDWQKEADVVARNVSGVAPRWITPEAVNTPHGTFEGGYWPIKYDRYGSNLSVIEDKSVSADRPFEKNYFRAATAKGHLKDRTGYVDVVDINTSIEQAAGTMQQMIHDISFRDAVVQVGRIFADKKIRGAIRNHYGAEYEAQLVPWLRRVANSSTVDEKAIQFYNDWQRRLRINLVGHALPLNLKVILSPDIGIPNPAVWTRFEANRSFNRDLAMKNSNEIRHMVYNMDRDFRERLEQTIRAKGWSATQQKAVEWGFGPMMKVSQEFRMATFVDEFNSAKAKGRTDYEASAIADSAVRERHGAASIVDLPAIMQSNETMKSLTMFYGYFNTMYNWQRQLPQQLKAGEFRKAGTTFAGSVLVGAGFGALLFNKSKEDDPWWKIMATALLLQPLSTVPIVREAASYFAEGFPQRTPTESLISSFGTLKTDIQRVARGESMRRPVQNIANVVGLSTGLPLAQAGRTGQFFYDVNNLTQRPRTFADYWRGIVHGEMKLKR